MNSIDPAKRFFDKKISERERAIFEGGIGLAAIFHQFIGTPVTGVKGSIKKLEKVIEEAALNQPYKKHVKVKINIPSNLSKNEVYNYRSLEGRDLDVTIISEYGSFQATSRMKYISELKYVLMYVENIEKISQ
ncbi:MAG: dihydroneopterin aldolase family protein [Nitrososphaerales archaeon]|jgi:hypothetical protein|nr:dihydroneopterin aldolase family protein [Nitrososphaerales archaeon]HJN58191.1 dihydroneopterin aldolase family protein [Nitrososphaerales archaeon]|tara:strand:+ start:1811 stop:2209 length:399 start_codon:yes stop_codon:yes gene_type:complete